MARIYTPYQQSIDDKEVYTNLMRDMYDAITAARMLKSLVEGNLPLMLEALAEIDTEEAAVCTENVISALGSVAASIEELVSKGLCPPEVLGSAESLAPGAVEATDTAIEPKGTFEVYTGFITGDNNHVGPGCD